MNVVLHDESQFVSSYYRPRKKLVKMSACGPKRQLQMVHFHTMYVLQKDLRKGA